MSYYIFVQNTKILAVTRAAPEVTPPGSLGIDAFVVDEEPAPNSTFVDGVVVPPPPVDPLPGARAAAWERIKQERAMSISAPITVGANTYDADETSQANMLKAIAWGSVAGPSWNTEWTLADNTYVIVDKAVLESVVLAIGARTTNAHAYARTLRAQIETATSITEVDAVKWSLES